MNIRMSTAVAFLCKTDDQVGKDVVLVVDSCYTEVDTSKRSWSADPDNYSWLRLWLNDSAFTARYPNEKDPGDGVSTISEEINFSLHPNYPNPFNPGTVIPVELLASGYCRLQVRDLMGKEVAVLHDGFLEAGTHRFAFDGRELPSGVYTYCIIVEGITRTRSMVLLR